MCTARALHGCSMFEHVARAARPCVARFAQGGCSSRIEVAVAAYPEIAMPSADVIEVRAERLAVEGAVHMSRGTVSAPGFRHLQATADGCGVGASSAVEHVYRHVPRNLFSRGSCVGGRKTHSLY